MSIHRLESAQSRSRRLMHALSRGLDAIAEDLDPRGRFIYVDYPVHDNVGDLLINAGSEAWFERHDLSIWRRYSCYNLPPTIRGVRSDDTFILHGGGNFGDLYHEFQATRERIVERYPDNPIVALPQTVYYADAREQARALGQLAGHANLRVYARDRASYDALVAGGLQRVAMAPDMAHALIDVLRPAAAPDAGRTLRLFRRDRESRGDVDVAQGTDWHRFVPRHRRAVHRVLTRTIWNMQRRTGITVDLHRPWYWHRDYLIRSAVDLFNAHDDIITDRMHAMLLGLLLDRPVAARDNTYGKLSRYYDAWLADNPLVRIESRVAPT